MVLMWLIQFSFWLMVTLMGEDGATEGHKEIVTLSHDTDYPCSCGTNTTCHRTLGGKVSCEEDAKMLQHDLDGLSGYAV